MGYVQAGSQGVVASFVIINNTIANNRGAGIALGAPGGIVSENLIASPKYWGVMVSILPVMLPFYLEHCVQKHACKILRPIAPESTLSIACLTLMMHPKRLS